MDKYIFLDFNGTVLDDVDLCLNLLNEMFWEKEKKMVDIDEYKHISLEAVKIMDEVRRQCGVVFPTDK